MFLTDEQYAFLHRERARTGLSVGMLVRHALDETYFPTSGRKLTGWQIGIESWLGASRDPASRPTRTESG